MKGLGIDYNLYEDFDIVSKHDRANVILFSEDVNWIYGKLLPADR